MKYLFHIWIIFFAGFSILTAQEVKEKKWVLDGYIKNLVTFDVSGDSINLDNLIHNRLNFKWFPSEDLNVHIDLRTRIFAGKLVSSIPQFGEALDVSDDYFDLSVDFPKGRSWLVHSMIDRAYIEWYKNDWEIRLGRQRINWGVNLVWNPNDLFNAYSYFDFDYTERPGSDAIRVTKYFGISSSMEWAVNINDDIDKIVLAGMYKWNKGNYDYQLIAAEAQQDLAIGLAWAGNIGQAGFKGEATYFIPYKNKMENKDILMASISVDYAFKSTLYFNASILFNSTGSDQLIVSGIGLLNSESITARNLSPFSWSYFMQTSYQFHPLINGGLSFIYFPGKRNALFINPTFSYSFKENIDLSIVGQLYYDKILGDYGALARLIYLRIKWSF